MNLGIRKKKKFFWHKDSIVIESWTSSELHLSELLNHS